jgi:hypothetical protein
MLYAEDVGGPGQAPTNKAKEMNFFVVKMIKIKLIL